MFSTPVQLVKYGDQEMTLRLASRTFLKNYQFLHYQQVMALKQCVCNTIIFNKYLTRRHYFSHRRVLVKMSHSNVINLDLQLHFDEDNLIYNTAQSQFIICLMYVYVGICLCQYWRLDLTWNRISLKAFQCQAFTLQNKLSNSASASNFV